MCLIMYTLNIRVFVAIITECLIEIYNIILSEINFLEINFMYFLNFAE